mgnify:CR=1 FL=1
MINRRNVLYSGVGAAFSAFHPPLFAQTCSKFSGDPILKLLPDPRNAVLVEAFSFTDPKGVKWNVPKGAQVNGASIPTFLWVVAGTPFVGLYRNASIIHDHYCNVKTRTWQATHLVFYDAMICAGVSRAEATSKYWAVYHFGPRWNVSKAPTQRAPLPEENAPYEDAYDYVDEMILQEGIMVDAVPELSIPMKH